MHTPKKIKNIPIKQTIGGGESLYYNSMWNIRYMPAYDPKYRESKHIYVGDSRLVTKNSDIGAKATGNYSNDEVSTYYYHSDHLGSAQVITDHLGNEYERLEYTPYGELWIAPAPPCGVNFKKEGAIDNMPFRFTGKILDEETGLYYYGARYLDPRTSRWLSADPATGDYIPQAPTNDDAKKYNQNLPGMGGVYNIVNLHTYHYGGNNPINYIDPDGRELWDITYSDSANVTQLEKTVGIGDFVSGIYDIKVSVEEGGQVEFMNEAGDRINISKSGTYSLDDLSAMGKAMAAEYKDGGVVLAAGLSGSFSTLGGVSGKAGFAIGIGKKGIDLNLFATGDVNYGLPAISGGVFVMGVVGTSKTKILSESARSVGGSGTLKSGTSLGADVMRFNTGNKGISVNAGIAPKKLGGELHTTIYSGATMLK